MADSEPPLLRKIYKKSRFLKMAAITLSSFKWPQLQYVLDDSLHLNTTIISRICSFQNCIYLKIPQNELALVSWEWVTNETVNQSSPCPEDGVMMSTTAFSPLLYVMLYDNLLEAQFSARPHVEQMSQTLFHFFLFLFFSFFSFF